MIQKILVATDNSEPAKKAVTYAADLARTLKAELMAVTIIDLPSVTERQFVPGESSPTHLIEPFEEYMKQMAGEFMDEIEKTCNQKGVVFKRLIRSGHPAEAIAQAAKDVGADLIVLGSHGRGALGAVLLGSVTLGVIHRDIHIPVLILK